MTDDIITEVAADFRLISPALPEESPLSTAAREDGNDSLLRSFFRLLRTMDGQQLESDSKAMQATAARRA